MNKKKRARKKQFYKIIAYFPHSYFAMQGNLSPRVLAENKGTAVFRLVPLRRRS